MSGRILILEIDVQGAEKIHLSDSFSIKPLFWFVHPPSRDALKDRLLGRGSENEQTLKTRLESKITTPRILIYNARLYQYSYQHKLTEVNAPYLLIPK